MLGADLKFAVLHSTTMSAVREPLVHSQYFAQFLRRLHISVSRQPPFRGSFLYPLSIVDLTVINRMMNGGQGGGERERERERTSGAVFVSVSRSSGALQ